MNNVVLLHLKLEGGKKKVVLFILVVSDITYQEDYFSMSEPGVGRFLVAFSLQGVVYIALLFAIELQCVRRLWQLLKSTCRRRKLVGAV